MNTLKNVDDLELHSNSYIYYATRMPSCVFMFILYEQVEYLSAILLRAAVFKEFVEERMIKFPDNRIPSAYFPFVNETTKLSKANARKCIDIL